MAWHPRPQCLPTTPATICRNRSRTPAARAPGGSDGCAVIAAARSKRRPTTKPICGYGCCRRPARTTGRRRGRGRVAAPTPQRRVIRRRRAAQTPAGVTGGQKPALRTRSADRPPAQSQTTQKPSADGLAARRRGAQRPADARGARKRGPQTTLSPTRRHLGADAARRPKPTCHRRANRLANRLANRRRAPPIRGLPRSNHARPAVAETRRVRRRPAATATKFRRCPTCRSGPAVVRLRGAGRQRAPARPSPRRIGRRVASARATTPPSRTDRLTRRYRSAPICPTPTSAAATPGRTWRRAPRRIVTLGRAVRMAGHAATDRVTCPIRVPDGVATADAITPWTARRPTRPRRPTSPVASAIGRRTSRSRPPAGSRHPRRSARRRCLRRHRLGRRRHRPGRP